MSESKVSPRLSESIAPEIIANIFAPRLAGFSDVFEPMGDINKAHVVMLAEQGILSATHSRTLARGILEMEEAGPGEVVLDPNREDPYFNYEAHLMQKVGADIGGRLHTGRSRNDIGATLDRIRGRAVMLDLIEALTRLRATAIDQAERYAQAVMPGYTHLQPAQPITYGFYLAAIEQALARDTQRLIDTLTHMSISPLGAAAFAGTPFNIDRDRTADLLGFDGIVENTLDAVASRDFMLEAIAHMSLLAVFWSRVAQDYYIWATHEFGLIDFPDSVATTSSIMPQKKNHPVLEYLKGKAGHIIGAFTAAATGVKGTNFSHSGEANRIAVGGVWESSREVLRCLDLFNLVLRTARPVEGHAIRQAAEDFSTATALADALVRDYGLSFRAAHHVVGGVVRDALRNDVTADRISVAMVEEAARDQLGRPLGITDEKLRECLDPLQNVSARSSTGGPSPANVHDHLDFARGRLLAVTSFADSYRARLASARDRLQTAIHQLADIEQSIDAEAAKVEAA